MSKLYRFEGRVFTLKELVTVAKGKEIFTDGRNFFYDLVVRVETEDTAGSAFKITKKQFESFDIPDLTTETIKKLYNFSLMKTILCNIDHFGRKCDMNIALKSMAESTYEMKVKFLNDNGYSWNKKVVYPTGISHILNDYKRNGN